jgi:hypothetical protein
MSPEATSSLLAVASLLGLCVAGCTSPRQPASTEIPSVAQRMQPRADVAPSAACASVGAQERSRSAAVFAEAKKKLDAVPDSAPIGDVPAFLGTCIADGDGAWFVDLEWARPYHDLEGTLGLRWSLAHVDAAERRVSVVPGGAADDIRARPDDANMTLGPFAPVEVQLRAFDFDGDGSPEIVAILAGHVHEGASWSRGRVWTFRDGAVKLYAPAQDLLVEDLRDVDGDGRPDLVTFAGRTASAEACGSGFEYRVTGPELVAHSRPDGTFSLTDEAAVEGAKRACPARPTPLLGPDALTDTNAAARNVVCARLWGATPAEALREVAGACRPPPVGQDACQAHTCPDRPLLERWAQADVPLRIR